MQMLQQGNLNQFNKLMNKLIMNQLHRLLLRQNQRNLHNKSQIQMMMMILLQLISNQNNRNQNVEELGPKHLLQLKIQLTIKKQKNNKKKKMILMIHQIQCQQIKPQLMVWFGFQMEMD